MTMTMTTTTKTKTKTKRIAHALLLSLPVAVAAAQPTVSPAQLKIAQARRQVEKAPGNARGYTQLAMALARRARETADPAYYAEGDAAVEKALAAAPGDFEARKARVWLRLGRHEHRSIPRQFPKNPGSLW